MTIELFVPRLSARLAGAVRLREPPSFTFNVSEAVRVRLLLVPLTVSAYRPAAVPNALRVSVEVPEPVTEAGLKLAVTPAGKPVTLKLTTPPNPPVGLTVMVDAVLPPWITAVAFGDTEMEKSGTVAVVIVKATVVEWASFAFVASLPVMVKL